jgi:hypothetical protein
MLLSSAIDLWALAILKFLLTFVEADDSRDFGTTTSHARHHHFSLDFIFH